MFPGAFSDENDNEIPPIIPQPEFPDSQSPSPSAKEVEETLHPRQESESLETSRSTTPTGQANAQTKAEKRHGKSKQLDSPTTTDAEQLEKALDEETRRSGSVDWDREKGSSISPELARLFRETAYENRRLRDENREDISKAIEISKKALRIAEETRQDTHRMEKNILDAIAKINRSDPVDTGVKSTQVPTPRETTPNIQTASTERSSATTRNSSRDNESDGTHRLSPAPAADPLSPLRGRTILPNVFNDIKQREMRWKVPQRDYGVPNNPLFGNGNFSHNEESPPGSPRIIHTAIDGVASQGGKNAGDERKKVPPIPARATTTPPPGQKYSEAEWDEYIQTSRGERARKQYESNLNTNAKPRTNERGQNEVRFEDQSFERETNRSTNMRNNRPPLEPWETSIRPAANLLDEEVSQMLQPNTRRPTLPIPDDNVVRMLRKAFITEEEAARRGDTVNLSKLGVKLHAPNTYDGKGDPVAFENWLTKVLGWLTMMNLNVKSPEMNQVRIHMLSQLLDGKALIYYQNRMERLALGEVWAFESAITELKERFLRGSNIMDASRRYDEMTQGTRDVQTLVEELWTEGQRLPDGGPPPFMFKVRLLEALRPEYVQHIIREGLRPETSSLSEIVNAAVDFEDSIAYEKRYLKLHNSRTTAKEQKPSTPKKESEVKKPTGKEPFRRFQHPNPRVHSHTHGRPGENNNASGSRPEQQRNVPQKSYPPRPVDKDKPPFKTTCFKCGQEGHISPNCPKKVTPARAFAGRIEQENEGDPNRNPPEEERENPQDVEVSDEKEVDPVDQLEEYDGENYSSDNELYRYSDESESEDENRLEVRSARVVPWEDPTTHARAAKLNAPPRPAVHRHRSRPKEDGSQPLRDKNLQRCIEVTVNINGLNARALLDTGSTTDMVSPSFVQVAKLRAVELETPMALQLAVSGSRTKINYGVWGKLSIGPISESRYFDVANIDDYDVILGTPFCWKHGVSPIFEDGGWIRHSGDKLVGNNPNRLSRAQDAPRVAKAHAEQPFREERPFRSTDRFFRGEGQSFRE